MPAQGGKRRGAGRAQTSVSTVGSLWEDREGEEWWWVMRAKILMTLMQDTDQGAGGAPRCERCTKRRSERYIAATCMHQSGPGPPDSIDATMRSLCTRANR